MARNLKCSSSSSSPRSGRSSAKRSRRQRSRSRRSQKSDSRPRSHSQSQRSRSRGALHRRNRNGDPQADQDSPPQLPVPKAPRPPPGPPPERLRAIVQDANESADCDAEGTGSGDSWNATGDAWERTDSQPEPRRPRKKRATLAADEADGSDSSCESRRRSPQTRAERGQPKLGVLYWGGGRHGQGWDFSGRRGFPRIDRRTDALMDAWKGRLDNAQATLRICASEGPGFKRYIRHFMMLSPKACVEFRLRQYHRFNTAQGKKVLTERQVIGGIIEAYRGWIPAKCGMRVSNGQRGEASCGAYIQRRARRYRKQAHMEGGHFAAMILEGGVDELQMSKLVSGAFGSKDGAKILRLMVILGGPEGISEPVREHLRETLEEYTDFPLVSIALPGGMLHSAYALANVLVFHDQGLLVPYIESLVGPPREWEGYQPQEHDRPWHSDVEQEEDQAWHGDHEQEKDRAWHSDDEQDDEHEDDRSWHSGDEQEEDRGCHPDRDQEEDGSQHSRDEQEEGRTGHLDDERDDDRAWNSGDEPEDGGAWRRNHDSSGGRPWQRGYKQKEDRAWRRNHQPNQDGAWRRNHQRKEDTAWRRDRQHKEEQEWHRDPEPNEDRECHREDEEEEDQRPSAAVEETQSEEILENLVMKEAARLGHLPRQACSSAKEAAGSAPRPPPFKPRPPGKPPPGHLLKPEPPKSSAGDAMQPSEQQPSQFESGPFKSAQLPPQSERAPFRTSPKSVPILKLEPREKARPTAKAAVVASKMPSVSKAVFAPTLTPPKPPETDLSVAACAEQDSPSKRAVFKPSGGRDAHGPKAERPAEMQPIASSGDDQHLSASLLSAIDAAMDRNTSNAEPTPTAPRSAATPAATSAAPAPMAHRAAPTPVAPNAAPWPKAFSAAPGPLAAQPAPVPVASNSAEVHGRHFAAETRSDDGNAASAGTRPTPVVSKAAMNFAAESSPQAAFSTDMAPRGAVSWNVPPAASTDSALAAGVQMDSAAPANAVFASQTMGRPGRPVGKPAPRIVRPPRAQASPAQSGFTSAPHAATATAARFELGQLPGTAYAQSGSAQVPGSPANGGRQDNACDPVASLEAFLAGDATMPSTDGEPGAMAGTSMDFSAEADWGSMQHPHAMPPPAPPGTAPTHRPLQSLGGPAGLGDVMAQLDRGLDERQKWISALKANLSSPALFPQ